MGNSVFLPTSVLGSSLGRGKTPHMWDPSSYTQSCGGGGRAAARKKIQLPPPSHRPCPSHHPLHPNPLFPLLALWNGEEGSDERKTNTNLQLIFIMFLRCLQTNRLNVPILPKREPLLRLRSAPN